MTNIWKTWQLAPTLHLWRVLSFWDRGHLFCPHLKLYCLCSLWLYWNHCKWRAFRLIWEDLLMNVHALFLYCTVYDKAACALNVKLWWADSYNLHQTYSLHRSHLETDSHRQTDEVNGHYSRPEVINTDQFTQSNHFIYWPSTRGHMLVMEKTQKTNIWNLKMN